MEEKEYFANMYAYIDNLSKEDKVSEAEYQSRLESCRNCENLISGMCRICGCYVEMRAAMKVRQLSGHKNRNGSKKVQIVLQYILRKV